MRFLGKGVPRVGGLVGMNIFGHRAITLDLVDDRVILETTRSLAERVRDMHPVNMRVAFDAGSDVTAFIEARAKTGILWLEIDSGNNGPVFLAPHAIEQLGLKIRKGGKAKLDLNMIGLGKIPVTIALRDMIFDGQLDPPFLRQMILTIDFEHRQA